MNKLNFYLGKDVYQAEMKLLQDNIEKNFKDMAKILGHLVAFSENPSHTGNIITIPDCVIVTSAGYIINSLEESRDLTHLMPLTGNKIITIAIEYEQKLSQPERDDYGYTQYWKEDDGYKINILESIEGTNPIFPVLPVNNHVLFDVNCSISGITSISRNRVKEFNFKLADSYSKSETIALIQNLSHPIGDVEIQFPFQLTPTQKYGFGLWEDISNSHLRLANGNYLFYNNTSGAITNQSSQTPGAGTTVLTYSGLFFRVRGGNAGAFELLRQLDTLQGHTIEHWNERLGTWFKLISSQTGVLGTQWELTQGTTIPSLFPRLADDGTNGTPRISNETRSLNMAFSMWKRIS